MVKNALFSSLHSCNNFFTQVEKGDVSYERLNLLYKNKCDYIKDTIEVQRGMKETVYHTLFLETFLATSVISYMIGYNVVNSTLSLQQRIRFMVRVASIALLLSISVGVLITFYHSLLKQMIKRKYHNETGLGNAFLGLITQAFVVVFTFIFGIVSTMIIIKTFFAGSNGDTLDDLFVSSSMFYLCLAFVVLLHVLIYFIWYVNNERRENVITFLRKTNVFLWVSVISLLTLFMVHDVLSKSAFYHPMVVLIIPLFIAGVSSLFFYLFTYKIKRLKAEYSDVVNKSAI